MTLDWSLDRLLNRRHDYYLTSMHSHKSQQPKSKFVQLFERDLGRCVYCGLDLKAGFDLFMMATEDHLVPISKGGSSHEVENLVLSCRTCNSLKSNFVPVPPLDPKKQRKQFITAVRKHILAKRSDRLTEFLKVTHPNLTDYQ